MRYRPDIDGLRAVAVLPVLLYHAGVPLFGGGFVGVDIFFVISGYLITGILAEEISRDAFTLAGFYERRVRRIFPALMAVLLATVVAGLCLLLPGELRQMARSVLATLGFVSNVDFYLQSGYFEARAETKPLLHTWSLSVEEQFYLIFPLALWGLSRLVPRRVNLLLAVAAALSLAASAWGARHAAGFAFYLAPTRVWELFAGCLLALNARRLDAVIWPRGLRTGGALLGVGLLALAIHTYTPKTPFPGLAALPPVLGTALLLALAPGTRVGAALATRPMVFVGQISYSLYLWHWPVLVFARMAGDGEHLPPEVAAGGLLGSLILAALSWRFIERPFRDRQRHTRRRIFALGGVATAALAVVAAITWGAGGFSGRFPADVVRIEAAADDSSPRRKACHTRDGRPLDPADACVYGDAARPRFVFYGDSHAVELAYALGPQAAAAGAGIVHLSGSACPPSQGVDPARRPGCVARNARVVEFLAGRPELDTVFLIGAANYKDLSAIAEGYPGTVAALRRAGKRVVAVLPIPSPDFEVPRRLARHVLAGGAPDALDLDAAAWRERVRPVTGIYARLRAEGQVETIQPEDLLCTDTRCRVYADGDALYFDDNHLTVRGAARLAPLFAPFFVSPGPGG